MSFFSINSYLQKLEESLDLKDGETAGNLLSLSDPHVMSPHIINCKPEQVSRIVSPPWDDVIIAHINCLRGSSNHDFIEAFQEQLHVVQSFHKIFQTQKDENWALSIMFAITLDLRNLAYSANGQATQKGNGAPVNQLEKAADLLMGLFRVCCADSRSQPDVSKRLGLLNIVNHLFKIYFKINKLHLCKPLIRAVDGSTINIENFSLAQVVTYKYYEGKKAMFDSDFKSAEDCLSFAFKRCHKDSRKNKRHILLYLIPVKMLLGQMPQLDLLKRYDLQMFNEVVLSVIQGNLSRLNKTLQDHQQFFIRYGIYFILEKLKIITYRNLFKKISILLKTHQIPLEAFLIILKQMGEEDIDLEEVHCIVANLIYENKIRGYLAYQQNKLVVSKQNAFPALNAS